MRQRPHVITARVNETERLVIEEAARRQRDSVSEVIRSGALRRAIEILKAAPTENTAER